MYVYVPEVAYETIDRALEAIYSLGPIFEPTLILGKWSTPTSG
jgi:hypothetical protein